jgi:hypothetical protein
MPQAALSGVTQFVRKCAVRIVVINATVRTI